MSSTSALNDQHVKKQAPIGKEFEILEREHNSILTPSGNVQYHVNLLINVNVKHKVPRGDNKGGTPTFPEQVAGTYHKGDNQHQTPNGDLKTFNGEDHK